METNFETQIIKVKIHLMNRKSISSWEAITLYRITRLSAIIFILRKQGLNINSVWESSMEGKKRWTRYHLANALDNEKKD